MAFSDQDVLTWFNVNQGASDADIAKAMQDFGVGQMQIARVTGSTLDDVTKRYNVATGQPEWTNRGVPMPNAPQPQGMMQPSVSQPTTQAPTQPVTTTTAQPQQQQGITDAQIVSWLKSNPNVSDAEIRKAMDANGVSISQMARATQSDVSDIQKRYDYAYMPKPTVTPTTPSNPVPNKPPVGDYKGVVDTTGMITPQSSGDYQNQMNQYYSAYFGADAKPDQGLLSSWYNTPYTPPVTGYVKPTVQSIVQSLPFEFGGGGGSGGNFNFGGATSTGSGSSSAPGGQGVNQTTAAGALAMMAASENPAIRALSPAVAALLGFAGGEIADGQINGMSAADAKLAASKALQDIGINTISDIDGNIRTISTPDSIAAATEGMFGGSSGSGGRAPGFGSFGNSSFGEGQY